MWDAALAAVRATLRARGCREVTTPVRVQAPALEPWIEPLDAPPGWLATSPELSMKRLICRGSGSVFQVSHCFRRAERGALHREEFHLAEWYRVDAGLDAVMADVEAVVAAVFSAVADLGGPTRPAPTRWRREGMLDLVEATTGVVLRGDEDHRELCRALGNDARWSSSVRIPDRRTLDDETPSDEAATLMAWTGFFSVWCDQALDPWLAALPADVGVHVTDFPVSLAALARCGRAACSRRPRVGLRFESHVFGHELANGYDELGDATEQRRRFSVVAALRREVGLPDLPVDEDFLTDLSDLGLPRCSGVALGLDRLVMLASGAADLDAVTLHLGAPCP